MKLNVIVITGAFILSGSGAAFADSHDRSPSPKHRAQPSEHTTAQSSPSKAQKTIVADSRRAVDRKKRKPME